MERSIRIVISIAIINGIQAIFAARSKGCIDGTIGDTCIVQAIP